jgi:hypothetical protein
MNPETIELLQASALDESDLTDMLRRDAARYLHNAAAELTSGDANFDDVDASLFEAVSLIGLARRVENVWLRDHPDDADLERDFAEEMRRASGATEATPHTTTPASGLRIADSSGS